MTDPLLCHHCGYWTIEKPTCSQLMNEKGIDESCFMLDRVSDEEYNRRSRILGLARQETLWGGE